MTTILTDAIDAEIALLTQLATVPIATGYGRDLVCLNDLTHAMRETDPASREALAQDLYHRLITRRGTLPDDPDYGIDVLDFLSVGYTPGELAIFEAQVSNELKKDDRVADVAVSATAAGRALNIAIDVTPWAAGAVTFRLIVNVSDAGAALEIL